jgi:hypothetical protein
MDILTVINIAKYVVAGIGCIGLIVLIVGIRKKKKEMLQYGILTVIASITILVCSYFIFKETIDRANNAIYEYMEEYNRQR